jgi:hypothetical protein
VLVSPPNNNYTTATEITFKWRRNPDDELAEFSKFRFQVSSDPTFTTGVHEVTRNKTEWTRQTQGAYTFYFYTYNLSQNTKYYWRVRAIDSGDNYGLWTQWILNIDNADPQPPVLLEPDEVFTTIFVDLNWTEPSDGPYRPKSYNVYRGLERDFECDSTTMVSTAGYVFNTYYTDDTPGTDKYYYRVTAVDNVGFESEPSNVVEAIVSIGGYVDARFQTFSVFEGNYFEYRIIDIVDYEQHDPQQRFISFLGHTFQWNSIFHYYIDTVDNTDVFPVSGRWYQKYSNETTLREEYFLVDSNANFIPMITSSNITYQTNVFDWFMNNVFTGEADEDFNSTITNSTYVDGLLIRNVVVHSYAGEIDPVGSATPRVFSGGIFVVDRESGILVEMTIYNKVDRVGYAIQLITTSYPLPVSTWIWNSIFLIIGLMIVAAVVNQIIKSLERRV